MLNRVRVWLRSLVLRRRLEREMQEEMAEHLDRATARLMARGLSAEEARREALREFGNVAYLQEEGRYARGAGWLDALAADLRFALRQFARKPGTTLTMLVVLAVGMSISTLLFSYVHSYAVQPPAGVELEEGRVRIRGSQDAGIYGRGSRGFSEEEFLEYRGLTDHFAAVGGWADATVALDAGAEPERRGLGATATFVTENYFPLLGVQPLLGSGLPAYDTDDPAMSAVAVISHAAWDQLYGRDPGVVGSVVAVNGVPVTIVGVAPERFLGLTSIRTLKLWMPLSAQRLLLSEPPGELRAIGRLRPGVDERAATAAVRLVAARAAASAEAAAGADRPRDPSSEVVPLLSANGDPNFQLDVRLMTLSVGLLGLLVLLVTCTNVSALLTGVATARRQEIAIRLSLGAARTRLIGQLLTESALLASVAAAAALGLVWLVLQAVIKLIPLFPADIGITWPATAFTFGTALAVGMLFGISPALHATRLALASALRDSTATIAAARARLQRGLVVAQIALTQPLIVLLAAVLLLVVRDYQPQSQSALGDRLITLSVRAPELRSSSRLESEARQRQMRELAHRLLGRLQATPGVEEAVIDWRSTPPLGPYLVHPADRVDGAAQDAARLAAQTAGEGYFSAMGIPLLRGREFRRGDFLGSEQPTAEVPVIVGAELARSLWAGADPLGRRLRAASDTASGARTLVVVGVIDDPRGGARKAGEDHRIYLPPDTTGALPAVLLRTAGPSESLLATVRTVVQEEAPGMIVNARTLAQIESEQTRNFRLLSAGVGTAGLMALLLSAIGLYAVVAFSVGQRTGEIAVRIAVGARGRQIVQKFVADGLRLSALGLAFGLPASLLGLRALSSASDDIPAVALPSVTAIAALGVVVVATAAAWIPARRAAAVDPAVTLRSE